MWVLFSNLTEVYQIIGLAHIGKSRNFKFIFSNSLQNNINRYKWNKQGRVRKRKQREKLLHLSNVLGNCKIASHSSKRNCHINERKYLNKVYTAGIKHISNLTRLSNSTRMSWMFWKEYSLSRVIEWCLLHIPFDIFHIVLWLCL